MRRAVPAERTTLDADFRSTTMSVWDDRHAAGTDHRADDPSRAALLCLQGGPCDGAVAVVATQLAVELGVAVRSLRPALADAGPLARARSIRRIKRAARAWNVTGLMMSAGTEPRATAALAAEVVHRLRRPLAIVVDVPEDAARGWVLAHMGLSERLGRAVTATASTWARGLDRRVMAVCSLPGEEPGDGRRVEVEEGLPTDARKRRALERLGAALAEEEELERVYVELRQGPCAAALAAASSELGADVAIVDGVPEVVHVEALLERLLTAGLAVVVAVPPPPRRGRAPHPARLADARGLAGFGVGGLLAALGVLIA